MMLDDSVELVDGEPVAYMRDISSLVVADLHLGYEAISAKQGALLPQVNLKGILRSLDKAAEGREVSRIIVNGDIKNEFSTVDEAEFNELYEFADHLKGLGVGLTLIKGNHDNFVERYRAAFKFEVHRQEARIGDYLFFHGEEMPVQTEGVRMLVMGHEHPAIAIYDKSGRQEKLKCFLYGSYKRKGLLVLPAMNYFAGGTAVNMEPKGGLLAPIFREADVDRMRAIALGYGSTLDFGTVKNLKRIVR